MRFYHMPIIISLLLPFTPIHNEQTQQLRLSDFMQSSYTYTYNDNTYTDRTSMMPIYTEDYYDCQIGDTVCASQLKQKGCPETVQWGCRIIKTPEGQGTHIDTMGTTYYGAGSGWKYGFTSSAPHLRYLSKGGFPEATLETFWYDHDWVYVFSAHRGAAGSFDSYAHTQTHPNVRYPYRGTVWYKNTFTVTYNPQVLGVNRWDGPTIRIPDTSIMTYTQNTTHYEGYTWPPANSMLNTTIAEEQAFYYPAIRNWGNVGQGMLPYELDLIQLEYRRVAINDPADIKFIERYYYARQTGTQNFFGLVAFENVGFDEHGVCTPLNRERYPGSTCETANLLLHSRVTMNHFKYLSAYNQEDHTAYTSSQDFWDDVMQAKPINNPQLLKGPTPNTQQLPPDFHGHAMIRGGFAVPAGGRDAAGTEVAQGDWLYLESNGADADWFFYPSMTTSCPEGYTYQGAIGVAGSLDLAHHVTFGPHWIALCGTDNHAQLEGIACAPGYQQRGHFVATLGGTTARGENVTGQWMNFCVHQSQTPQ